ncbi:MAG: hypothetical protein KME60_24770 [Cyanomargarita calcarea GSE-NOS-MK-12-04C]|uniref:Filamentous hemagglutinin n=1 Tax=Cyanomargarita calcarea GSE-NOS-MK-12-04C TaxID=2839659 RepID=A0A951UUB2_9CYAN|nr:hypothetical protein [Cyanomargarita calcarea GSE-NOS-MK-12-04C]
MGTGGVGNAGNIDIQAGSLTLKDGAVITANTFGLGNSGNISIKASGDVSLIGAIVFNNIESGGVGKGGDINIKATSLILKEGGQLQAFIRGNSETLPGGRGEAGSVNIDVPGAVTITGTKDRFSGIFSNMKAGGEGRGGDINIKAGSLSLIDNAILRSDTAGKGNGGNVIVQASDSVSLKAGQIYSSIEPGAIGNGGNIKIETGSLLLTAPSELNTNVRGQGNGGNITINARDAITLEGRQDQTLLTRIISSLQPTGIGKAGDIQITTGSLKLTNLAFIDSSTQGKGQVDIKQPNVDPTQSLFTLSTDVIQSSTLIAARSCGAGSVTGSEFTVTGRGGLPPSPDEPLTSNVVWTDNRVMNIVGGGKPNLSAPIPPKVKAVEFVPATGWVFNGKGEVTLISSISNTTPSAVVGDCS